MNRKTFDRSIGIAFIGFIALGLPAGLLGLAWPSIQAQFDLPASALGSFLLAASFGFILMSIFNGAITRRIGIRRLLIAAFALRGAAYTLIFLAPSWEFIVLFGFFAGVAEGGIDPGLNLYVAGYENPRLMNWLHGFFGVGATLGPLLMVALFNAGLKWSFGYLLAGVIMFSMLGLLLLTHLDVKRDSAPEAPDEAKEAGAPMLSTLRLPLLWFGMAAFALAAGLEASTAQWSFSLFTQSRAIDATAAGIWVSLFLASFTAGRFAFGFVGNRFSLNQQIRGSILLAVASSLMVWINPVEWVGLVSLGVLGVAIAPQFPLLVTGTAKRVGSRHLANVVGLQVGAASFGFGMLPSIGGLLIEANTRNALKQLTAHLPINTAALTYRREFEIVAPYFVALAVTMLMVYEGMLILQRRNLAVSPAISG